MWKNQLFSKTVRIVITALFVIGGIGNLKNIGSLNTPTEMPPIFYGTYEGDKGVFVLNKDNSFALNFDLTDVGGGHDLRYGTFTIKSLSGSNPNNWDIRLNLTASNPTDANYFSRTSCIVRVISGTNRPAILFTVHNYPSGDVEMEFDMR